MDKIPQPLEDVLDKNFPNWKNWSLDFVDTNLGGDFPEGGFSILCVHDFKLNSVNFTPQGNLTPSGDITDFEKVNFLYYKASPGGFYIGHCKKCNKIYLVL